VFEIDDNTAKEIALHSSLCVCAEYIQRWGLLDFLVALEDYSKDADLQQLVEIITQNELEAQNNE